MDRVVVDVADLARMTVTPVLSSGEQYFHPPIDVYAKLTLFSVTPTSRLLTDGVVRLATLSVLMRPPARPSLRPTERSPWLRTVTLPQ